MNFIKNILFAYTICKKYKIKMRWWLSSYKAQARWNGEEGYMAIAISPFHEKFKQTFLHELSHLLSFNRMYRKGLDIGEEMTDPVKKFKEETKAWLFAKRILKQDYCKGESHSCLMSYSRVHYFREVKVDKIHEYTDNFVKCMSRV